MWNWSKFAGKVMIHLGVMVLGFCAMKELFEDGMAVVGAAQNGTAPEASIIPEI
jgi:hypothetical protein